MAHHRRLQRIGEATERELAEAGAKLLIDARRAKRLKVFAEELGEHVAWREPDVTDVLVNNAGVMPLEYLLRDQIT